MNLPDVERDPHIAELRRRVRDFVALHAIPRETRSHVHDPTALDRTLAELRPIAQEQGLYLPQLPREHGGLGLSWVQRAVVLEEAGRSYLGPGAMNCAAPDQPNMISLLRQGTQDQQRNYLGPLAAGEIRSCFAMTEPAPGAGSDPSMLQTRAERAPGGWVIRGHKWFITGAVGARFAIVLAQTADGPTQFIVDSLNPGFHLLRAIPAIDPYAIGGHQALAKVLATPAMKDKLAKLGATVLNPSFAAFDERVKADRRAWDPVLRTLDLKTQ